MSARQSSQASSADSYVGQFAPSVPVWGYDHRQCIVRVLGARIECRAPDACCNPYLTHAVMLAAMRDGIANRIEPGDPHAEDDFPARAVADLFPAYDQDGGLLLVLTPSK